MKNKNDPRKDKEKKVKGLQVLENECIWMKAGIVNFHLCDNNYDCNNCPFDKSMQIAMGKKMKDAGGRDQSRWANNLIKENEGAFRPCRHALTGRADAPKICTMNYECFHCPYDQWLDEYDISGMSARPTCKSASGYKVADGYYYHNGHSWVLFEHGGIARIGFDDFLVKLFGVMDTIKLPGLGKKVKQGIADMAFERNHQDAEVCSPVSGRVLAVNHKSMEYPGISHSDPYGNGWLCIIEPDLPLKDKRKLHSGPESLEWMENESRRLMGLLGPEYENLSATGAEPIGDIIGNFPELGWDKLVKEFLKT